jgi:glutathione S-transferase
MTKLRLLGYPVSNYVNIVRAALLEKGLPFEFVATRSSQDAAFRELSPLGKIPVLDTGEGSLTETVAILDYLDDVFPDVPLRPRGRPLPARAGGRRSTSSSSMSKLRRASYSRASSWAARTCRQPRRRFA